jgi:hypothetical protein
MEREVNGARGRRPQANDQSLTEACVSIIEKLSAVDALA